MEETANSQLLLSLLLNYRFRHIVSIPGFIRFYAKTRGNASEVDKNANILVRALEENKMRLNEVGFSFGYNNSSQSICNEVFPIMRSYNINPDLLSSNNPYMSVFAKGLLSLWINKPFMNSIRNEETSNAFIKVVENLEKLRKLQKIKKPLIKEEKKKLASESIAEARARHHMSDVIPTAKQSYEAQLLQLSRETLVSMYSLIGTSGRNITSQDNRLIYNVSSRFLHPKIVRTFPESAANASSEARLSPFSHWNQKAIKEIWGTPEKFEQGYRRWGLIQRAKWRMGSKLKARRLLKGG